MSKLCQQVDVGATAYTVAGSFLGGAAGGGWLCLVLLSLAGLYGEAALWVDLASGVIAVAAVVWLARLCAQAAGRPSGLRVVLVAGLGALNVIVALYLFGEWVCIVSPEGPAFSDCRILAPLGDLSILTAIFLPSPSLLAAAFGAVLTIRSLLAF